MRQAALHLVALTSLLLLTALACCQPPEEDAAPDPDLQAPPRSGGKSDQADFERSRAEEVRARMEASVDGLPPELRAEKFSAMAASPFAFYRGTAHLFWADFGQSPRLATFGGPDTQVWLQGDMHAGNMGAFDNDKGAVVYDLNDFDEAVIADYQLDLWRLATSVVLLAREGGIGKEGIDDALDALGESYLDAMGDYRGKDDELGARFDRERLDEPLDDFLKDVEQGASRQEMLKAWCRRDADDRRILDTRIEDLEEVDPATAEAIKAAFPAYLETLAHPSRFSPGHFTIKSVARRLHAGVGSLGTPRYYVLIEGPGDGQDDDRILDVKLQGAPAGCTAGGLKSATCDGSLSDHAQRVVQGHRALASEVDEHLGVLVLPAGACTVRERSPFKKSFPLDEVDKADTLVQLASWWGLILATAHARADKDFDPALIPGSVDKAIDQRTDGQHAEFRALLREIALAYADQVEADYAAFLPLAPQPDSATP